MAPEQNETSWDFITNEPGTVPGATSQGRSGSQSHPQDPAEGRGAPKGTEVPHGGCRPQLVTPQTPLSP